MFKVTISYFFLEEMAFQSLVDGYLRYVQSLNLLKLLLVWDQRAFSAIQTFCYINPVVSWEDLLTLILFKIDGKPREREMRTHTFSAFHANATSSIFACYCGNKHPSILLLWHRVGIGTIGNLYQIQRNVPVQWLWIEALSLGWIKNTKLPINPLFIDTCACWGSISLFNVLSTSKECLKVQHFVIIYKIVQ